MLKRKAIRNLKSWYKSTHKKAALVTGARQVGKTTAIREFARQHYKHFVEINFVKRPVARQAFDGDLDTSTIVANLSAMGFGPFVEGQTLVFFDEIQECPNSMKSKSVPMHVLPSSFWLKNIVMTSSNLARCWASITRKCHPILSDSSRNT